MFQVRRSSIHGRGCFATEDITPGTVIASCECIPAHDPDGSHVLWLDDEPLRVVNDLRFLNHAAGPNAELDALDLRALRAIAVGEEITIHYGPDWDSTSS